MESTERFKEIIANKLREVAANDSLFAVSIRKESKNIEDCITYILNQVQKSGLKGFSDSEIFGMAIHYYNEDVIEIGGKVQCQIISNHQVKLSEEELAEAKKLAMDQEVSNQRNKLRAKKPNAKENKVSEVLTQKTLF